MALRGNMDHRHQNGLRWLHRPLMSTWPLVATQPMVFFQFSFFLNVYVSFVTGIEPGGMHILSKWSVTVLHPKPPSRGSFHLSPPTLSLLSLFSANIPHSSQTALLLYLPLAWLWNLSWNNQIFPLFNANSTGTSKRYVQKPHRPLPLPTWNVSSVFPPRFIFCVYVQGIQHPKTNSVLFIRFYLWPYHNFSQTPFFILFTNCCLLY